jgi:hypothetical protein
VIGSVGSREVNATSAWLAMLTAKHKLPQKLFIIHQFVDDMVETTRSDAAGARHGAQRRRLRRARGQVSKYKAFSRDAKRFHQGFKLFYEEDVGLMTPRQVVRLKPSPDVVMYE